MKARNYIMYYLTITAKRKNAKRHIAEKSNDIEKLEKLAKNMNECYVVEIYDGRWNLIKTIEK